MVNAYSFFKYQIPGQNCSSQTCRTVHYEELGCKPIRNKESACCPTRYECPSFKNLDPKKCHFEGKSYDNGVVLNTDDLHIQCRGQCSCRTNPQNNQPGRLQCPVIDCPDMFDSIDEECIQQYALDKCCSVDKVCGKEIDKLAECSFEGKTYREGQMMYANDSLDKCLCTKDFDSGAKIEENPNCAHIKCGVNLQIDELMQGCVPIYYTNAGCVISWRCRKLN